MPTCHSRFHGAIEFEPEQALEVPEGLFGFTDETRFLLLELPSTRPMVFIQSVKTPNLCFLSLPVQVIDERYHVSMKNSDRSPFRLSPASEPKIGHDLLWLALLTLGEGRPATANLLAPLVIDIANHRGMQIIVDGNYSHQHQIPASTLRQAAC